MNINKQIEELEKERDKIRKKRKRWYSSAEGREIRAKFQLLKQIQKEINKKIDIWYLSRRTNEDFPIHKTIYSEDIEDLKKRLGI